MPHPSRPVSNFDALARHRLLGPAPASLNALPLSGGRGRAGVAWGPGAAAGAFSKVPGTLRGETRRARERCRPVPRLTLGHRRRRVRVARAAAGRMQRADGSGTTSHLTWYTATPWST